MASVAQQIEGRGTGALAEGPLNPSGHGIDGVVVAGGAQLGDAQLQARRRCARPCVGR